MSLNLLFSSSGRTSTCLICGGGALDRERHIRRLHKDVEAVMRTSIDKKRLLTQAKFAWTSTPLRSVLNIDEFFVRGPIFLKCNLCKSAGIKEGLAHLCRKHGSDFKVEGNTIKIGSVGVKLVEWRGTPTLKNFFSPQPTPRMQLNVKVEPESPEMTPPASVNRKIDEVIVIDSPEEATPSSRNNSKAKKEKNKKRASPSQSKAEKKRKAPPEEENESEEESILDSDTPITFTQFLYASDPVRAFYTIWHHDVWEMEWQKCETPTELFALLEKISNSDVVNDSIDWPPKGGVPGLIEISHDDLSKNGRMCLMRWAVHVEICNGGCRSGEKEDAVEVWNRTVRILNKRLVNGVFKKRGKKSEQTKKK